MSEQVTNVCVVIFRETGKFLYLTDIMQHCGCQKQIALEHRISAAVVVTQLCHTERMLQ